MKLSKFTFALALTILAVSGNAFAARITTNRIEITTDAAEWLQAMKVKEGNSHNKRDKYEFKKDVSVKINGAAAVTAELNTRGQNCLKAKRPCFGLKLKGKKVAFNGNGGLEVKNMNLVSMWEDQGYISSKIGFEFLRATGIADIQTEYAELIINNQNLGLYLLTEKPKRAAERSVEQQGKDRKTIIGRRSLSGKTIKLDDDYLESFDPNVERFKKAYDQMNAVIRSKSMSAHAQRDAVMQYIDLSGYMRLLLSYSLLRNGDYSDELYYYADASAKNIYFRVLPWDLDDIFRNPHAGAANAARVADLQSKLLYSYEAYIDVLIADNLVMYSGLQSEARTFFNSIATDEMIDKVINNVKDAISPYLENPSVLNGHTMDRGKAFTKQEILKMLELRRNETKQRRVELLKRT